MRGNAATGAKRREWAVRIDKRQRILLARFGGEDLRDSARFAARQVEPLQLPIRCRTIGFDALGGIVMALAEEMVRPAQLERADGYGPPAESIRLTSVLKGERTQARHRSLWSWWGLFQNRH